MEENKSKAMNLKAKRNQKRYLQASSDKKLGRPIEWTDERIEAEAAAFEEWLKDPENYYFSEFALGRGYTSDVMIHLASISPLFSRTMARAREIQERRIVKKSLDRTFDGNFAKFVLANRHGWKEKTEISGDAANPLAFILNNIDGKTKDIIDVTPEPISSDK